MKVKKKALSTRSSQASQGRKFPKMNLLKSHGWRQAGHLRKQICNFDCDAETANLQCLKVSCEVTLLHYLTTFTWLDHNSSPQYLTWLHYSTAVLKEASLLHFITWLFTLLHYWTTLLHFSAWQITLLHCLATLCHFMRCVPYAHYLTWLQYCTTARSDRDRKASFRRLHPRSLGGTYRWKKHRVFAYLLSILFKKNMYAEDMLDNFCVAITWRVEPASCTTPSYYVISVRKDDAWSSSTWRLYVTWLHYVISLTSLH